MSIIKKGDHQFDMERVLYDLIDDICKYLNIKDLCNVSQTNRSWRDAALRETAKRYYIQQLRLPCKIDKPTELWAPVLVNMLRVRPYASLMIYDSRLYKPAMKKKPQHYCLEEELMDDFKKHLRHKVVLMKVYEYLTSEDAELEGTKDQRKIAKADKCNILGLFFPSVERRARVDIVWAEDSLFLEKQAFYIAEKLSLNNSARTKSTLLLFAYSYGGYKIANMLIRNRIKDGKETVWAIGLQNKLMTADYCYESYHSEMCLVAMRISGPRVMSWTALIDCRCRPVDFERKLRELKEKVTLGRYNMGLFYAPRAKVKFCSQAIMRQVKYVFPTIPLVGLFNRYTAVYQTPDNIEINDDVDPLDFWFDNYYMSIIIIAYD